MTKIKKILLKSQKPSHAFYLLRNLNALKYFYPLNQLSRKDFNNVFSSLDSFVQYKVPDSATNIIIMLSLVSCKFKIQDAKTFITKLTNNKNILKYSLSLLRNNFQMLYTDSELFRLASKVNIEHFLLFSQAKYGNINPDIFINIRCRAEKLGVLYTKAKPFLQGRDIVAFSIAPSKEFSTILNLAYEAQINLEINSHAEAIKWLKEYLKNRL